MRFIHGQTLDDAIKRFHGADQPGWDAGERRLALRELLGRFVAVCNTVAYAHSRGILHRDLKPANVMLGNYGETLVVDWGLAKPFSRDESARAVGEETLTPASGSGEGGTQTGAVMGTPSYMSPEQAAGEWDRVGTASDLYSLGAILYKLLTGQTPFEGSSGKAKLEKVKRGDFPRPRQLTKSCPAALEAVCLKAMALRPQERYATALALAAEVEHWLAGEPVGAWPEPWRARCRRWVRRHRTLASAAGTALLVSLLALTAGALWYQGQQAEAARKLALTEQAVRQSLDQAQDGHAKLLASLKKPGGVQQLLNQPARWELQIQTARADWQRAQMLAANAEGSLAPGLTDRLQKLQQQLDRDHANFELARQLERIRLERATVVDGKFNHAQALQAYPRTFQKAGLALEPGRQKETAQRIRQSAIKEEFVAALDDWAWVAHGLNRPDLCSQLLAVARLADPDPWRDQVRDLANWNDPQTIAKLAGEVERDQVFLARQSPQMLLLVCVLLPRAKEEAWLRLGQGLHPADFWINFGLAFELAKTKEKLLEAVGFYRVALALRPDTAAVYTNLGYALLDQKDLPGAIAALQKALVLAPKNATAWNIFGAALYDQKGPAEAVAAFQHALDLDPKYALAWNNLGNVRRNQKDLAGALAAYRKALQLNPKLAEALCNLGITLRFQGEFAQSLAALRAFQKLAVEQPAWKEKAAQQVLLAEHLPKVDLQLPKYLRGEQKPDSSAEALVLRFICTARSLHTAAVGFARQAFDAQPKLTDNLANEHRYHAACSAALAGCGQGKDAPSDARERVRLRQQALEWLRADLKLWTQLLDKNTPKDHLLVRQALQQWQRDPDLAGVRDAKALAKLPEAERKDWQQLWTEVDQLLRKTPQKR
jgi:serine/threonine-protein kinase